MKMPGQFSVTINSRGFQPDIAAANYQHVGAFAELRRHYVGIVEVAHNIDALYIAADAGRQAARHRAGGLNELVVGNAFAATDHHLAGPVDRLNPHVKAQIDAVLPRSSFRAAG